MGTERYRLGYRRDQWVVVDQLCRAVVECGQFAKASLCLDLLKVEEAQASNFLWHSMVDGKML